MAINTLSSLNRTLQETHTWLKDIAEAIEDQRIEMAYHAMRGVLFTLRDRLPVNEVFDLSAQLPMLVRGILFEGYRPSNKPETFGRDEFLDRVRVELQAMGGANPERITRGVFHVLSARVGAGEIDDIRNELPKDLRALWPAPGPQEPTT